MNLVVILTATAVLLGAGPAGAQDRERDRGGLGGVLDTLGGLLGTGSGKLSGGVVLAQDTTLVLRTDDRRTVRIDTASIDPQVRQQLVPGQSVTVTTRGTGDVLTATDIQIAQGQTKPQAFSRVGGTVQERSEGRVLFRTKEGLTLPVDTSQIRGLPYLATNTPATLIYEQGPRQDLVAIWIQPGDAAASASPTIEPSASVPGVASPAGQRLEGLVESIGVDELTLQTSDGRLLRVDTTGVDEGALADIRPGDIVRVTGNAGSDPGRFNANDVARTR